MWPTQSGISAETKLRRGQCYLAGTPRNWNSVIGVIKIIGTHVSKSTVILQDHVGLEFQKTCVNNCLGCQGFLFVFIFKFD